MNRIDIIASNAPDGEIYLVHQICEIIAGDRANRVEFNKGEKQYGWQTHIQQAMKIIETVREWDKNAT